MLKRLANELHAIADCITDLDNDEEKRELRRLNASLMQARDAARNACAIAWRENAQLRTQTIKLTETKHGH